MQGSYYEKNGKKFNLVFKYWCLNESKQDNLNRREV